MALVGLEDFADYLRAASLADGAEGPLLQEHLDAAHEVVTAHVGEHGSLTVTTYAHTEHVVLPLVRLASVVQVRDPLGAVVTPVPGQTNLLAGIVVVPVARPGVWEADVVTREAAASTALAVKIIGAHLWSTRRGSSGGAASSGKWGRSSGEGEVVTTGFGYAIPRRAAELLRVEGIPVTA